MGTIDGSASTEIEAPIAAVYAVAADVEGSPRWQPEIKVAECIERDADGNQVLVHGSSRTSAPGEPWWPIRSRWTWGECWEWLFAAQWSACSADS
jgi:hypothetical protein